MTLRDRLRRLTRSDVANNTTNPPAPPASSHNYTLSHASTTPSPSLSKTSSRLNLSKTLTFGTKSNRSSEEKRRDKLEEWARRDEAEWRTPTQRRGGRKSQIHQDTLRAFAWGRKSGEFGGRKGSGWSGVSPGTSRLNSVDDGVKRDA